MAHWVLYLFMVSAVGCTSTNDGDEAKNANLPPKTTYGSVPEEEFVAEFGGASCVGLAVCCQEAGHGFNAAQCQALTSAPVNTDPSLTYDPRVAGECLNAVQNAEVACDSGGAAPAACDRVYQGSLQPGEACSEDVQCATSDLGEAECDLFDSVCTVTRRGVLGDACSASCEEVGTGGYVCTGGDSSLPPYQAVHCYRDDGVSCEEGVCSPIAAIGEPCTSVFSCGPDTYCDSEGGVCAAVALVSESCDTKSCVAAAYCADDATCRALGHEGEPCTTSEECVGFDCDGSVCGPDTPLDVFGEELLSFVCGG
jgi:hypothetical protein